MRIQFTLTPQDIAEAARPIKTPAGQQVAGFVVWTIAMIAAAAGVVLSSIPNANGKIGVAIYDDPPGQNFWAAVVPNTVFVVFTIVALTTQSAKQKRLARDPGEPMHPSQWTMLWLLLPWLLLAVPTIPRWAVIWHPTPWRQCLAAVIPWLLMIVWVTLRAVLSRRRGGAMSTRPALSRPHSITVTDDGVHYQDAVIDQRTAWPYILRCRETAGLIVLTTENVEAVIVPKRAFADPTDLFAFKALLQSHVRRCDFVHDVTGFPVVAAGNQSTRLAVADLGAEENCTFAHPD